MVSFYTLLLTIFSCEQAANTASETSKATGSAPDGIGFQQLGMNVETGAESNSLIGGVDKPPKDDINLIGNNSRVSSFSDYRKMAQLTLDTSALNGIQSPSILDSNMQRSNGSNSNGPNSNGSQSSPTAVSLLIPLVSPKQGSNGSFPSQVETRSDQDIKSNKV